MRYIQNLKLKRYKSDDRPETSQNEEYADCKEEETGKCSKSNEDDVDTPTSDDNEGEGSPSHSTDAVDD